MTTEEKLKAYILTKYKSIREFTQAIDLPYSTMSTILKRGIENSNVQNIIRICQALEISTDDLAEGRIVPVTKPSDEVIQIEDLLNSVSQTLMQAEHLTIDGKPATKEDVYLIISTIETVMEIRKKQHERMAAYYTELLKKDDAK